MNVPVLLLGETGTGKSLLGKVIHHESARASWPYLAINCAGIPDALFESEFFGHQRGAFTGARENRRGLMEQAQMGTLFLDEVGELPVSQQAKLLTVLEEGEIMRLGGEGTIRVDVRVLAATSRDLSREMGGGGFRRELFHRLAVLTCHIPPLRDRREDIPVLARRILRNLQERHGCSPALLPRDTMQYLEHRPWLGNVRELSHLLEAALILSEGEVLEMEDVRAAEVMGMHEASSVGNHPGAGSPGLSSGPPAVSVPDSPGIRTDSEKAPSAHRYAFMGSKEEEREVIRRAFTRARGNKTRAAKELGMARNTLRQKLRRYGLT